MLSSGYLILILLLSQRLRLITGKLNFGQRLLNIFWVQQTALPSSRIHFYFKWTHDGEIYQRVSEPLCEDFSLLKPPALSLLSVRTRRGAHAGSCSLIPWSGRTL